MPGALRPVGAYTAHFLAVDDGGTGGPEHIELRAQVLVLRRHAGVTISQGRLLVTMLAAIVEFERELIRERKSEGRKRAKANGVRF